ncbi:MAG TPA: RdgB/HAM1 family non-canonical purine NTP pyrophosphatase [Pyrinomonadaceae bacterium]|nr:RdgB/HAM1 family non-canonical purine NTP pyrophosphatase [Pyrinomonadaceae bacterium]
MFSDFHISIEAVVELVVATRNRHKTREIQDILGPEFKLRDLGAHPDVSEIRESGTSFEENAKLKAVAASRQLPALVIADDSGLGVDALGGAPGIFSARYAGRNATERAKIDRLLRELARVRATEDGRRAQFRCVVALARNGNLLGTFEGIVEGSIADEARGDSGFGYDPIFIPEGLKQTFGELPTEVKNTISHRAKAVRALADRLRRLAFGD